MIRVVSRRQLAAAEAGTKVLSAMSGNSWTKIYEDGWADDLTGEVDSNDHLARLAAEREMVFPVDAANLHISCDRDEYLSVIEQAVSEVSKVDANAIVDAFVARGFLQES